jgi:hypothetical protein
VVSSLHRSKWPQVNVLIGHQRAAFTIWPSTTSTMRSQRFARSDPTSVDPTGR